MPDFERLGALFTALGSTTRLALVNAIVEADPHFEGAGLTISELARATEVSRFSASRHLAILRECGIVLGTASGRRTLHRLNSEVLDLIDDWLVPLLTLPAPLVDARSA